MTIYIDADACPVTRIAEDIARKYGIPVTLLCDTNHRLTSDYSTGPWKRRKGDSTERKMVHR